MLTNAVQLLFSNVSEKMKATLCEEQLLYAISYVPLLNLTNTEGCEDSTWLIKSCGGNIIYKKKETLK